MKPEFWDDELRVMHSICLVLFVAVLVGAFLSLLSYDKGKMAGREEGIEAANLLLNQPDTVSWKIARDSILADWGIDD